MVLEALLFDVDGTLADTERDGHRVAFNMAFKDAGLDWFWDEDLYGQLLAVTGGKERMAYYLEKFNTEFKKPDDLPGFLKQLHQSKTNFYTELLAKGEIGMRPGVKRLIQEARDAGLRLAVATTTTPENVEALLVNALHPESMSWFEVIAAGDVVPAKKPAPDIFVYAMEKMNLSPEQCLALEDSQNGIRASLGAKLATVITTNGYTENEDFSGAALVVDHLGEPDMPCETKAGWIEDVCMVDIELLKKLHAQA